MIADCSHMIKAVSVENVTKVLKKKNGNRPSCKRCHFTAFDARNELWICLQCAHIACGDMNAQDGDITAHYKNVADHDSHAIVLHINQDLKCWCYTCDSEIDQKSDHLKKIIRTIKAASLLAHLPQREVKSVVAIPLPPPQPAIQIPTITETEWLPESVKSKGNNNRQETTKGGKNEIYSPLSDKPAGLSNLGNTCFMNSTLQCLASTPMLIPKLEIFGRCQKVPLVVIQTQADAHLSVMECGDTVKGIEEDPNSILNHGGFGDSSDITKPLQLILDIGSETMTGRLRQTIRGVRKYETSKYRDDSVNEASSSNNRNSSSAWFNAYRPGEVHELVAKNFRRGAQHDAHELLRTILDMMKKDQTKAFRQAIMKHYGVKKGGEGTDPTLVEMVKALDEKVKHKTFVDEVFGGELMTTQTCLTCKLVRSSHEQFLDLSLPLRVFKHGESEKKQTKKSYFPDDRSNMTSMKSLQECLIHFTEAELLTGSNVVECENCHRLNMEKIEQGISPEQVFPALASEKSSSQSSPDSERKHLSKKEERQKRREARGQKKSRTNNTVVVQKEIPKVKEVETDKIISGKTAYNEFFEYFDAFNNQNQSSSKEGEPIPGSSSSQTVDGFVLLPGSTVDEPNQVNNDTELMDGDFDMPALLDDMEMTSSSARLAGSKQISESLQHLNLKLDRELDEVGDGDEDDDEFDLPPAVDGIGGSASDDEESRATTDLDIGVLPAFDKFRSFQLQVIEDGPNEQMKAEKDKPSTTGDEGFSEGENSMSVDNNEARMISQASSSRNSLSESDEISKSSTDEGTAAGGTGIKLPKVTKCPCSRQQKISRPPENLTIHFKRFQTSLGGYATKINEHVTYPMILDLTPYCSRDEEETESNGQVFDEDEQVLYALYGIVEHSGSMNWGHYVAYVKSSENDKRWFYISDSSVSLTPFNRVTSVEAYILFYERIRGDEKKRRLSVSLPQSIQESHENLTEDELAWKTGTLTNGTFETTEAWSDQDPKKVVGAVISPSVAGWSLGTNKFSMLADDIPEPETDTPTVFGPVNQSILDCQLPAIRVEEDTSSPSSLWSPGVIYEWPPSSERSNGYHYGPHAEGDDMGIRVSSSGNAMEEDESPPRCQNPESLSTQWELGG